MACYGVNFTSRSEAITIVEQSGNPHLPCTLLRTKQPTPLSVGLAHECPAMSLPLACYQQCYLL